VEEAQGVDEVLATFDEPTRGAFRAVLVDLAKALDGRSEDLNTTLGNAAPATGELRRLVEVVERRGPEVEGVVRDSGTVLRSLAARRSALQRLVVAGDLVLGATADRDRELEATVRALPPFLRDARRTLATAEATAIEAATTLRALRPVRPAAAARAARREALLPARRAAGARGRARRARRDARRGTPSARRGADAAGRPRARCSRRHASCCRCSDGRRLQVDAVSSLAKAAAAHPVTSGGGPPPAAGAPALTNESFYGQEQCGADQPRERLRQARRARPARGGRPAARALLREHVQPRDRPARSSPGPAAVRRAGAVDAAPGDRTFPGVERDAP
jgi:hypothetical protein